MSEGDPGNWAAVARAVSHWGRELGWRQRELAVRSRAPEAFVGDVQWPASLFSGNFLFMPAITSGYWLLSHEVRMQFRCISSATDSGSDKDSAGTVQPRCNSLVRRFTGRCGCR